MTKGKALLEARRILGPSAHVRFDAALPAPCKVGTFDANGWRGVAVGKTWGSALQGIEKCNAALAWKTFREKRTAEIVAAQTRLSSLISALLKTRKMTLAEIRREMRAA